MLLQYLTFILFTIVLWSSKQVLSLPLEAATQALAIRHIALAKRNVPFELYRCSPTQTRVLNKHIDDMITMAQKAAESVHPSNPYYAAVFPPPPSASSRDEDIKGRFEAIANARGDTPHSTIRFRCDFGNQVDRRCKGFGAPAITSGAGTSNPVIWLCLSYWSSNSIISGTVLPRSGSQVPLDEFIPNGGLLLHEWTHAIWETDDVKLKTPNPNDQRTVAYGQENVLRLGREPRAFFRAKNNADSYRIFAAMVTLPMTWSTDPDKIRGPENLRINDEL